MFKASSELPPGWAASEFDHKDNMGDNWLPRPAPGHNGPPGNLPWTAPVVAELTAEETKQARRDRFEQLARENLRRLYLAQLKCLLQAADDPRVTKPYWQLLSRIIRRTNTRTGMSYPGRDWLAVNIPYYDDDRELRHYSPQVIANMLVRLGRWGYLEQDMRGIDGKGRALAHYVTLTPDLVHLQGQITRWCDETPKRKRPDPDVTTQTVTPETSPPERLRQKAGVTFFHLQKGSGVTMDPLNSPRETRNDAVYLEDINLGEEGASAPAPGTSGKDAKNTMASALGGQVAYANRNIIIAPSGKISIGDEFRAELKETYNDSQIERGLDRAPSQAGGSDPVKLLSQIRRCCSYAKQDDEKAAAIAAAKRQPQSTRRTFER